MPFRFHKAIRLGPIKVNLSKTGVSVSAGSAPLTVNAGQRGVKVTASAPGTGFSFWTWLFRGRR